MKKHLVFVLCAAVLLCAGCAYRASTEGEGAQAYQAYFQERDLAASSGGDALRAVTVYLEKDLPSSRQVEALLEELLKEPVDETLKSAIPAGTVLLSAAVEDGTALVDLSASYGTLSGVGLTLADYAITLTLSQLPEVSSVTITVRGQELAYRDQQTFTAEDVLLSSKEDVVSTVEATLYFLNDEGMLAPESRTLDLYEGDTQILAVTRALEEGPEAPDLSPVLPEGFRAKSVWLEEDLCFVNLPSGLLSGLREDAALSKTLLAMKWSLESLDAVTEVRFLVDGAEVDTVREGVPSFPNRP